MNPEMAPFADHYSRITESELFAIARHYHTLTEPAQASLRAEFATRKLEPPDLETAEPAQPGYRQLVTLRRYRDLSEAIVARSMLEAAGIAAWLRDENLVRLEWQISNFIGGIRLQVDNSEAEAAAELLSQPIPESIALDAEHSFVQPKCPTCQSVDITFEGRDRRAAILSVHALSLPVPLGSESWLCNYCVTRWQDVSETDTPSQ